MFSINISGGLPIYEQLAKRITEMIINKSLMADEKIPTVRTLAKELGINPNTVQKAYQQLERDGLIYSIPGKGSYIADSSKNMKFIKEKAKITFRAAAEDALKSGLKKQELITEIEICSEGGRL